MRYLSKRTACSVTPVPFQVCRPMLVLLLTALLTALIAARSTASSGTRATPTAVSGARLTASGVNIAKLSTITLTAYDYSFAMPMTMVAGLTDIKLVNAGSQPHQASFGRVKPGVTVDQVLAAAKRGSSAEPYIFSALDFAGGPSTISPYSQQETILNLRPGHYVALCFVPGPDGMPHYQMGMITPFTVTTASGQAPRGEPTADVVVRLVNFGFVMPANLRKGDLVKVVNQANEVHEMSIVQLAPGKTVQDILAWAKKPSATSPFLFVGGMAPIAPGSTEWLRLSLNPGRYVTVCFVIDPATSKRHVMLGMIYPFTVQA
jgi:outer membrane protein assembly factor BamE (lipoprotein component of BamABCDE complex)